MSTKFFIGGNVFYDTEEEAEAQMAEFVAKHGVSPHDFSIVKIEKQDDPMPQAQGMVH